MYNIHPVYLRQALLCMQYMKDRIWIDLSSIDIWLMHAWESIPQRRARYIPSTFITPTGADYEDPTELNEEIDRFRDLFDDLPPRGTTCPLETLVYVLNCGTSKGASGNHFCVVVFAPTLRAVYLLGKEIHMNHINNNSSDWDSWQGRRIWSKACRLMGWNEDSLPPMARPWNGEEEGQPRIVLRQTNWKQNGNDCGPIACQVSQHILLRGLQVEGAGQWKQPAMVACCHTLRLKMAELVHQVVVEGCRKFGTVRTRNAAQLEEKYEKGLEGMDGAQKELKEELQLSPVVQLHPVMQNLRQAIQRCNICHLTIEEERQRAAAQDHPIPIQRENIKQAEERRRKEALEGAQSMNDYVAGKLPIEHEEKNGSNDNPTHQRGINEDRQEIQGKEEVRGNQQRARSESRSAAVDWKQARIGRFPRPKIAPDLPSRPHLRGLRHPFDRNFDNYEGGPTLEDLAPIPETLLQFQPSLMYICNQIMLTPAPYTLFKDYGYRLLPCFAQAFDLGKSILVKEHLCPILIASWISIVILHPRYMYLRCMYLRCVHI
jgi:hypothetical protein